MVSALRRVWSSRVVALWVHLLRGWAWTARDLFEQGLVAALAEFLDEASVAVVRIRHVDVVGELEGHARKMLTRFSSPPVMRSKTEVSLFSTKPARTCSMFTCIQESISCPFGILGSWSESLLPGAGGSNMPWFPISCVWQEKAGSLMRH